jgi:hypothetical protein
MSARDFATRTIASLSALSVLFISLGGCGGALNTFEVVTLDEEPISAFLKLCDEQVPMGRKASVFSLAYKVRCEGSGQIDVQMQDGRVVVCRIGYVTNLEDEWKFLIKNRVCTLALR